MSKLLRSPMLIIFRVLWPCVVLSCCGLLSSWKEVLQPPDSWVGQIPGPRPGLCWGCYYLWSHYPMVKGLVPFVDLALPFHVSRSRSLPSSPETPHDRLVSPYPVLYHLWALIHPRPFPLSHCRICRPYSYSQFCVTPSSVEQCLPLPFQSL